MRIIISILIGLMFIGLVPMIIGYVWELLLNVYDMVRGNCSVRDDSRFIESLWKYFVVILVLFVICLMILVFMVIFRSFTTGVVIK